MLAGKVPTVAVIGGGYTGAVVTMALARLGASVVLIEKRSVPGHGLAYSAQGRHFTVNVRAAQMRPFEDKPDDFADWIGIGDAFPPRLVFGHYVAARLQAVPYRHVRAWAEGVTRRDGSLAVALDSGAVEMADAVVLALGNPPPRPLARLLPHVAAEAAVIDDPWAEGALDEIPPEAPVLIVGTGLTMADTVTALRVQGHRGAITAVSRRGLLPHVAGPAPELRPGALDEHPVEAAALLRMLRAEAAQAQRDCGDWRRTADEMRVAMPAVWRRLTPEVRARLERHAGAYWSIHRYRMPPAVHAVVHEAIAAGALRIVAGGVAGYDGHTAHIGASSVLAAIAINCTGPDYAFLGQRSPLLESLLKGGLARRGAVGNGLMLDDDDGVLQNADETPAPLFAAGPTARARYGELTTATEIGRQAVRLADAVMARCSR